MKKLIGLIGILTITSNELTTITNNNFISTKLEINANKNKKQNNIERNESYYLPSGWTAYKLSQFNSTIKNVFKITTNSNRGAYFTTNDGVFYGIYDLNSNDIETTKIGGINEPIADITIASSNSVYFTAVSGNAYYLGNDWWNAVRIDTYYNVPEIKNILTIKTNGNAVYYSTANGIYYMSSSSWKANKIGGINEPIADITIASSNSVYFTAVSGNAYYLGNDWWNAVRIDTYYNVPEIKNILTIKTNGNAVYYSTANGIYYMSSSSWKANKIGGINEPIADIIIDSSYRVYFVSLFKFPENKFSNNKKELEYHQNRSNPTLTINNDWSEFIYTLSQNVYRYLINERIIVPSGSAIRGPGYAMNNQSGYFIINMNIEPINNSRRLQLVINRQNLYLEGFIVRNGNSYYSPGNYRYFSDATYQSLNDGTLLTNENLGFNGDYNSLNASGTNISLESINASFQNLINNNFRNIRQDLVRIILATSESLRFGNIPYFIQNRYYNNWNQFQPFLKNWNRNSINYLNSLTLNINGTNYYNIDNNINVSSSISIILSILNRKQNEAFM